MNYFGGLYGENSQEFVEHVKQQAYDIARKFKENNIALSSTILVTSNKAETRF